MSTEKATFEELVCKGLGYCCVWAFFQWGSKQTGLIADRLGVTSRCVRKWKARYKANEVQCQRLDCCMKPKMR